MTDTDRCVAVGYLLAGIGFGMAGIEDPEAWVFAGLVGLVVLIGLTFWGPVKEEESNE